jgi:hypothetical protein
MQLNNPESYLYYFHNYLILVVKNWETAVVMTVAVVTVAVVTAAVKARAAQYLNNWVRAQHLISPHS